MKFSALALLPTSLSPAVAAPVSYNWQNVAIGGGYVTGVYSHPARNAAFLRTDVGGFYRRNGQMWQPISDGFDSSQSSYYGGEGFAFDPQNHIEHSTSV